MQFGAVVLPTTRPCTRPEGIITLVVGPVLHVRVKAKPLWLKPPRRPKAPDKAGAGAIPRRHHRYLFDVDVSAGGFATRLDIAAHGANE